MAARAMRICEIETVGRGGLIHYAHNLSSALAARGHDVTLVTSVRYDLEPPGVRMVRLIDRATHAAARRLPAGLVAIARKVEAVADAWTVTRLARRLRPDVIHLHCTTPIALVYLLLLRRAGIPVAVTAHVVTAHERSRVGDVLRSWIHRLSPLIIAHSAFDRKRLTGEFSVDPARVAVVPHGEYGFFAAGAGPVDRHEARQSLGIGPDEEAALFFGYIRRYKGLDLLLDAWPDIVRARPRARLVIAGDPARLDRGERAALEHAARRVGAVHRFDYVPFREVRRLFAAADILVLPYRHVSQSGVLFLALALGLPVVATRVGALPEVVRDEESALLVTPGSPAALAHAVSRLLGDAALRERLAAGGLAVAAQHSWPAVAARTEAVFGALAAARPHRAGSPAIS